MNTVMLYIGLFILIPSLMYIAIYHMVNAAVLYQKSKTKTNIATNIEGVRENKYNVPQHLLKRQSKLKDNKIFAQLGFLMGSFMVAVPLLFMWWQFLKVFIPTLIQ